MKRNILIQNKLMNYVKSDIKRIIDTALNKYDNIVYYHKYKRFYKGHYGLLEELKDKVSLATACFHIGQGIGYIKGLFNGWIHRIRQLRRDTQNGVK